MGAWDFLGFFFRWQSQPARQWAFIPAFPPLSALGTLTFLRGVNGFFKVYTRLSAHHLTTTNFFATWLKCNHKSSYDVLMTHPFSISWCGRDVYLKCWSFPPFFSQSLLIYSLFCTFPKPSLPAPGTHPTYPRKPHPSCVFPFGCKS